MFSNIHSLLVWWHKSAIQIVKRFLTKKDKIRRYLQRLKQNIHRQLILNALQIVFVLFGSNEIFHVVIFYFQPNLLKKHSFGWK